MAELEKPGEPQDAGADQTPIELGESGTHQDDEARQAEAGATTPADEPKGPAPTGLTIPEKFKGKSAEEIAAAYLEVEKDRGRLAQEQGELRQAINYLAAERAARENMVRQQQEQSARPEPVEDEAPGKFNWDNPDESIRRAAERESARVVNEQLGRFVQAMSQAQVAANFNKAAQAHDQGKSIMSTEKRLFEGIEQDVERMVYESLRPFAAQGQDVSGQLVDPQTWKTAAAMLRYQRGEFDRMTPSVAKGGMTAPPTNIPSATRPQADDGSQIDIDETDRRFAEAAFVAAGMDNKTAREAAQRIAKETIGRTR